jgi:hypothetical protein
MQLPSEVSKGFLVGVVRCPERQRTLRWNNLPTRQHIDSSIYSTAALTD